MCYRPLHIFNPKLSPTFRDRVYIDVPCGHCEECKKRQRSDWFVRSFFQWKENNDVFHGVTLYVTLTYNNTWIPRLPNHEPCFSKSNVQKFLKRFRITMQRQFAMDFKNIKYFITSEYGEQGRPHHHGLIFIPRPCSFSDIYRIKNIIRNTWSYGFVNFGRKLVGVHTAGVVQSPAALSYVCKYISKDMYFNNDVDSDFRPFHLQSQHYGEYMINHFGLRSGSTFALATLIDGSFVLNTNFQFPYAIPQYITRKCLFNYYYERSFVDTEVPGGTMVTKNITIEYILNDLGRKVKREQEFHTIEYQVSEFNRIFENVSKILNNSKAIDYVLTHTVKQFTSVDDLIEYVESNYTDLSDVFRVRLAMYTRTFKDRVVIPNAPYFYGTDLNWQLEDFQLYLDDIYNNDEFIKDAYGYWSEYEVRKGTYNFRNWLYKQTYASSIPPDQQDTYEILLSIFNSLVYVLGKADEEKSLIELNNYNNAKLLSREVI